MISLRVHGTAAHPFLVAVALLGPGASTCLSQGSVAGWVVSEDSKEPVTEARVLLIGSEVLTCTGLGGYYVLTNIAPNTVQLRVLRTGYRPITKTAVVTDGRTASLDFELSGTPVLLQGTDGGSRMPTAAQHIVSTLFKNISVTAEGRATGEAMATAALAAKRAVDRMSPDYVGTLNDLTERRNGQLKRLLLSARDSATFEENMKRNPETGCRALEK